MITKFRNADRNLCGKNFKKVKKVLQDKAVEAVGLQTHDPAAGVDSLFAPMFWTVLPGSHDIRGSTDSGLIDVKICLSGEVLVCGVPFDQLPGETPAKKLAALKMMKRDFFLSNFTKHSGFMIVLKEGSGIVLHPRYAIIVVGPKEKEALGIRWKTTGSETTEKQVLQILRMFSGEGGETLQKLVKMLTTKHGVSG